MSALRVGSCVAVGMALLSWAPKAVAAPFTCEAPDDVRDCAVPFRLVHGQILVDVDVGLGSPVVMNVDTGVFPSVVDTELAERLALATSKGGGAIAGYGSGTLGYRNARLPDLRLGGLRLESLPVIVTRTQHMVIEGVPLMGTLGESFFRRVGVEIDYAARVLRFGGSSRRGRPTEVRLDADLSGPTPRIPLTINGVAVDGWIDTGGSTGFVLSEATVHKVGLASALDGAETVEAMGTRGRFQATLIEVDELVIGGLTVQDVHALVLPSGPTWIGNEVWKHFVLRLDYAGSRIGLTPSEVSPSR